VNMNVPRRCGYFLPMAAAAIALAFLLLFVYGYPYLLPLIEIAAPENFERAVANAMTNGNVPEALKIARRAAEDYYLDSNGYRIKPGSMAFTVYGRVLLAAGRQDEALAELDKAVNLRRRNVNPYDETRKPFYFAPARLTLGKYFLEQGQIVDAVENFELARPYASLGDPEYDDYRASLYQAYARLDLWARALEFGEPSDQELDTLDTPSLVRVGRVCEGARNWTLMGRVAERLGKREETAGETPYLLGRAALAQGQYEASARLLEQAVVSGRTGSAFFLGEALEKNGASAQAIQAFLRSPSGDIYRPFALAKAWKLLTGLPETERTSVPTTEQELLNQLDLEIARLRELRQPVQHDKYVRLVPVAFQPSEVYSEAGGRFPLLVLWEDRRGSANDPARMAFADSDTDDNLLLRRTDGLLQLQWVENLVNWESIDHLEPGSSAVPGWIDTARDWFDLRSDRVVHIEKDTAGDAFLNITKLTWYFSVPVPVKDVDGYLLLGRVKGQQGKGSIGWQALDAEERVADEDNVKSPECSDAWTWQTAYARSQFQWEAIRVLLNVAPQAGTISFDDVMFMGVKEPDLSHLR